MTNVRWIPLALATAGLLARPVDAHAQVVGSVSAVALNARHRLLSERLTGAAVRVGVPIGGRLLARGGVEHAWGDARRTGVPCAGLIEPGTCASQPLRDEGRLTTASAGIGLRLLDRRHVALEIGGALRAGQVEVDTRGMTSGETLRARKTLTGAEFGVEGAWQLSGRLPLALEVGAETAQMSAPSPERRVDGYTPFNVGFNVTRLRVGLAWRRVR